MARTPPDSPPELPRKPPRKKNSLPPEVMEIMWPALQVGGLSAFGGTLFGAFSGVLRSAPPTLFALAAGIQWFALGTTFTASRGAIIHMWGKEKVTPQDKVFASGISGAIGGAAGGALRSNKNILPGALMFTLFGSSSQYIYNTLDSQKTHLAQHPELAPKKHSWLDSKYSPMKVLTDEQYQKVLREKLLAIDTEIALIDERIGEWRGKEREDKIDEMKKDGE